MNNSITQSWTKLRSALLELPPLREDETRGKHRSVKSLTFGFCTHEEGLKLPERRVRPKSKASTPVLSRSFTTQASDLIEGVSELQLHLIYEAKCADLHLPIMALQQRRFVDFCCKHLRRRVWNFTESGVGPRTGRAVAECIKNNPHFCQLLLGKNELGDKGAVQIAKTLSKALNIVHLDLSSNSLGPEGLSQVLRFLSCHESLISLDLSSHEGLHRNRLALEGALALGELLKRNKLLVALDVSGTAIGGEGFEAVTTGLASNRSLLQIGLSRNGVRGKALLPLCKLLPLSCLSEIRVAGNPLSLEGAEVLSNVLSTPDSSSLRLLDISETRLGFSGSERVFDALSRNMKLHTLLMSRNPIGDAPNPTLAGLLYDNSQLRHLDLSECGLRINGLKAIGEGLGRNHSLEALVLAGNVFGTSDQQESFTALAAGLEKNSALKLLDLSSTRLNDKAVAVLCEAIWTHTSLAQLLLKDNDIRDRGAALLADLTRVRRKMTKLTIENNSVSFKYVAEIRSNLLGNAKFHEMSRIPQLRRELNCVSKCDLSMSTLAQNFTHVQSEMKALNSQVEHERRRAQQTKQQEEAKYQLLLVEGERVRQKHQKVTRELQVFRGEIEVGPRQEEQLVAKKLETEVESQLAQLLADLKSRQHHCAALRSAGCEARQSFSRQLEGAAQLLSNAKADKRSVEMSLAGLRKQVELIRLELETQPRKRRDKTRYLQ